MEILLEIYGEGKISTLFQESNTVTILKVKITHYENTAGLYLSYMWMKPF